jgi:diguanylate cyclase (GGDEF)-like protein
MFIDLDQFKVVNDAGGHAAGDGLLRRVAEVLPRELRAEDLLARLGGDEFGVILPDCSPDTALAIAQRLRAAVQEIKFVWEGQPHGVGASIGLVYLGGQNLTLAQALRAADIACYIAKEKGRNRVHVYAPDDLAQAGLATEMGWVQRLQRALELNRFQLHAQSTVATAEAGRKGEHLELLLRLDDGDGRLTPPGAFIPAAERFGLMPAIDRWVVHTALEIIASRRAEFYGPAARTYAINLSGITLTDETFLPFLRAELASSGVPPEVLCFEITETSAIANLERAAEFIEAMQAMGSRFALDDFGGRDVIPHLSEAVARRLPEDRRQFRARHARGQIRLCHRANDQPNRAHVGKENHRRVCGDA